MLNPQEAANETGKKEVRLTQFTHGLGCACKMRPQDLEKVLAGMPLPDDPEILVDLRDSDDATVWKVDDETAWVQSVDFFTPVVDDPYTFGAIAAANALSDIYAMGARPLFGLNIVAYPVKRLSLDILDEILRGSRDKAKEAGIHVLGGHTIEDPELKFGMVINGIVHPSRILKNSGATPGDALILTKPLGTGILSTALKKGILQKRDYNELINTMSALNDKASLVMSGYPVNACTDVTGFGLLGHLLEMLKASGNSAEIRAGNVPMLKGAGRHLADGVFPGGSIQNLNHVDPFTEQDAGISRNQMISLADAQTSGGLLIALPGKEAENLRQDLRNSGCPKAEIIGNIIPLADKVIYIK